MKKIVPFTKDLMFKTRIKEITSIALDNTLKLKDNSVYGEFIISGTYKMLGGETEEEFQYNLPVDITIDNKYETKNCLISIDDFSYEIINEEKLKVNISVMLDDLDIKIDPIETVEITIADEQKSERSDKEYEMLTDELANLVNEVPSTNEEKDLIETDNFNKIDLTKVSTSRDNNDNLEEKLFQNLSDTKEYSIYRVYTMKEDDTLELIYEKFNITKETLAEYNDLDNLTVGTKIIIPSVDE